MKFLHYFNTLSGDADALEHKPHLVSKVLRHGSQTGTRQRHWRAGKSGLLGPAPMGQASVHVGKGPEHLNV